MKLAAAFHEGRTVSAVFSGERVHQLPVSPDAPTSLEAIVADLGRWPPRLEVFLDSAEPGLPLPDVRPTAPLRRPRKIVAVGLNYADHATGGSVGA